MVPKSTHKPDPMRLYRSKNLWAKWHLDPVLFGLLLIVCIVGLLILYSASDRNLPMVLRQSVYMGIGFVVMIIVAQIPPRTMNRWSCLLYGCSLLLLLAVLVSGDSAKGAQRWINFPGLRFQPAELMKLAMPLTMAWFVSLAPLPPTYGRLSVACIIMIIPVMLIALQPDLGTSLLIGVSGLFVILLAGLQWQIIAIASAATPILAFIMWHWVMRPYQKMRVLTFLDPEKDPWGAGWNIIQSKIAIGSGGLQGKGWLMGTQSHLEFLPESHTDFILAVLGEEFGLVGIIAILVLYMAIVGRGLYLAQNTQLMFARLASGSIIFVFFVYLFVNIGMVSGLLPVVGVPLPMVSRGGTSIVTLMAGFGIVMSAYTHRDFMVPI